MSLKDKIKKQGNESFKSKDEGGMSFTNYLNYKTNGVERFRDVDNTDYLIDLLPYKIESENHPNRKKDEITYNMDIWVHKGIGADKGNYICMKKTFNKPCKICEEFLRLQGEGQVWDDIKGLYPSRRIIYNIKYKDKIFVADMSFKTFEELWLTAVTKLQKKGKDLFPIYSNEEGCTSLEFSTTDKKGIGRYIQFDFSDIENFDIKVLSKVISLEKLLVIPDQNKLEKILRADEVEDIENKEDVIEDENVEDDIPEEQEEIIENEDQEIEENKTEAPIKKEKKEKKEKCPFDLKFGIDFDEYKNCDDCLQKFEITYQECGKAHKV